VAQAYHTLLPVGRHPVALVLLEMDPAEVDVNVHPTKQEVRFYRPQRIHQLVVQAVRLAIETYQDDIKFSLFGAPREPLINKSADEQIVRYHSAVDQGSFPQTLSAESQDSFTVSGPGKQAETQSSKVTLEAEGDCPASRAENNGQVGVPPNPPAVSGGAVQRLCGLGTLVPIGQLMNLYLLCENRGEEGESLVVIDQHAAHERLVFETLKKQFTARRVVGQSLLFPQLIDLAGDQVQVLNRHRQEIERLGIDLEEFGEQSYVVKAVPAILSHLSVEEIMVAILDQFQENDRQTGGRTKNTATRIDDILSAMACKAAVKAGRALQPAEMEDLLNQMHEAEVFSHCPHGRPVFKSFTESDIKKWFHRT
jgi:DNA mismatch repair protein MutL